MTRKELTRLFDLLDLYANEYRDKQDVFLRRAGSAWVGYSASDYIRLSREISLGLMALGVRPGTRIATVMNNCPEWNLFDMGIMMCGAVQVPIYPTVSDDNYCYILRDAGIEWIIVSDHEIYKRIVTICPGIPGIKGIFTIPKIKGARHWKEIPALGREYHDPAGLDRIKESIAGNDLATIIYTSGTTGRPKGVMLSHRNFISNFTACASIYPFKTSDRALSFLPLCHVYERMLNYLYQYHGMSVFYVETLDKVGSSLREVRPTTFAAVPRVLEKVYNRFVTQGRSLPGFRRILFFWALRQGHKFELNHARGWFYDIKILVANILVFRHWRKALGGRIRLVVSGSASLHPRLTRIYWAAGMPVMEGYGLTETSPVISVFNFDPGGVKFGTVGKVLPGVEVKIAHDGEILCKGPNIMLGYLNRPEKTQEAIDEDGWFHTGDIGMLEDGQYMKITDRKKEMFKTSTGKYIAPHVIEQKMKESPFIENILVLGENRKYVAALIVPNFEYLRSWCGVKKITFTTPHKMVRNSIVMKRIQDEVDKYNLDLGKTERIKKIRLLPDEWSVATGELSPTLKLRRKFIQEKYYQVIEDTYRSPEFNYRVERDQ